MDRIHQPLPSRPGRDAGRRALRPDHRSAKVVAALVAAIVACACPSRDLPAPVESEPKKDEAPPCGKVFRDPGVKAGSTCCMGPSAEVLKKSDIMAACGATEAQYLGETRDGRDCRFHFRAEGIDPRQSFVMLNRPVIPPGAPAPVKPDAMLPWTWKKVALRDALGYQVTKAPNEPGVMDRQTILWAGRGRRVLGMRVSKKVCTEQQAQALLQRAIDGVP
jgi:hypothetical protein